LNLEVFCYLGLLKFPEKLQAMIALLQDPLKAQVAAHVQELKDLPRPELERRWAKLRDDEYIVARNEIEQKINVRLDDMPPSIRVWCTSWLADQHE
jgi:cell division protein FtsB